MQINLPDIDIKPDWNIAGQVKKIGEEYSEVAEAAITGDPVTLIREALDTMQTCCTLINMVVAEYNINMDKFIDEHNEKLQHKGYLKFIPSKFDDCRY